MSGQKETPQRVLCLDGGGIRGLVTLQMLENIEEAAGRPIKDCFDWIAGTSTGAIIGLQIATGCELRKIRERYQNMNVFDGSPPYSTEKVQTMLKEVYGEDPVMADIRHSKVLVTSVEADTAPPELHMFRSYHKPGERDTQDVPIWQAAQASGAAPFYFHPVGNFLDGGLIANNPTLDALTEIQEYYQGVPPVACVVSLGTGWGPRNSMPVPNFYWPPCDFEEWLIDAVSLTFGVNLLLSLVTMSEGRPVDRAKAWCQTMNVPFYRFNLELSENVPLNCTDKKKIGKMMEETQRYMEGQNKFIRELGNILSQ